MKDNSPKKRKYRNSPKANVSVNPTAEISQEGNQKEPVMAFGKDNYIRMIVGVVVLMLGFIIMTLDSEPFGFGFLGLTLGPIVVMVGFAIQFFAILTKSKE